MTTQTNTAAQDTATTPDLFLYNVRVGFTTSRPVRPDEHVSLVTVMAKDDNDAHLLACMMACLRPGVEMPTSSEILCVEL